MRRQSPTLIEKLRTAVRFYPGHTAEELAKIIGRHKAMTGMWHGAEFSEIQTIMSTLKRLTDRGELIRAKNLGDRWIYRPLI